MPIFMMAWRTDVVRLRVAKATELATRKSA